MVHRAAEVSAALQGRYAIERELGRGGMATVYLAEDRKLHRRVALKLLHPDLGSTLGPERFLREIAVASRLTHPNILALHDSGEAGGRLFYAMPFVDGESLRERLRREPQFHIEETIRIVRAIAGAMDYAHREGVIHRDIKPENILLAKDPAGGPSHPLLADFGIARALDAAGGERLTATGVALGTPSYMSPEQAAGERVDGRSDLYALGCVAYEMLAGAPPFTGPTAQAILARHAVDPVPALRTVRSTVPPAIVHAIERALAKVPADRFATATEFADALAAQRSHWRERVRASRLRPAGLLAGAAVVLGLGAVVVRRPVGPIAHAVMPSAGVIAVLPFRSPRGDTALTRLGRDLATTVSASLDGVGGIRTADRLSIASASVSRAPGSPDAEAGLARRLGAGSMLLGTLVPTGKKVRLDLGLYAVEGRGSLAPGITITADRDSLAVMTDSIVWTLIRAEQRFGDGDGVFTVAEQSRAINALYDVVRGEHAHTAPGRRARVGVEIAF